MSVVDPFAPAMAIADAVLYDGYLLYPYRASAQKHRIRWLWGLAGPPAAFGDGAGEDPELRAEFVVEHTGDGAAPTTARVRVRFLRAVRRRTGSPPDDGSVRSSIADFDEAEPQTFETSVAFTGGVAAHDVVAIDLPAAGHPTDLTPTDRGATARSSEALTGTIDVHATPAGDGLHRLRVAVSNTTPWTPGDDAPARSLIGVHVVVAVDGGTVLSATDPPPEHGTSTVEHRGHRLWTVLVGRPHRSPLALAAPVILDDLPAVAPESPVDFHDGLEIDELLSLRVLTMTDAERAEARATDARAAAIVDRVDALTPDDLARLHGVVRPPPDAPWWDPAADARVDPDTDTVLVAGQRVGRGSTVRLRPRRRADAQDMFFAGRRATVAAIVHDVDGAVHVAVTVDDDPAADLLDATGRFHYFAPDEVEPLGRSSDR